MKTKFKPNLGGSRGEGKGGEARAGSHGGMESGRRSSGVVQCEEDKGGRKVSSDKEDGLDMQSTNAKGPPSGQEQKPTEISPSQSQQEPCDGSSLAGIGEGEVQASIVSSLARKPIVTPSVSGTKLRKKVPPKVVTSRSSKKTASQRKGQLAECESETSVQECDKESTRNSEHICKEVDSVKDHIHETRTEGPNDQFSVISTQNEDAHHCEEAGVEADTSLVETTGNGDDVTFSSGEKSPAGKRRTRGGVGPVSSDRDVSGEGVSEKLSTPKRKKRKTSCNPSPNTSGEGVEDLSPSPKKSRTSTVSVREAPNRSTMTMQELIYYNPTANPMSSKVEDTKRKQKEASSASTSQTASKSSTPVPPDIQASREKAVADEDKRDDPEQEEGRIVPQLRIGKDGKIIIDEESMLMETTAQSELPGDMGEIIEGAGHTTSASYRNRSKITKWTKEETSTFFKALSQVGTDFTMMTLLLPKRSRKELKNKFKKEEKNRPQLITQALKNQMTIQRT